MNFETTLYDILGVSSTATQDEIKKAYRKKSRLLHPDSTGQDTTDMFQMVQKAYNVLSKEDTRTEYDEHLERKENPVPEAEPYEEPEWGQETTWDETTEEDESVWEEVIEDDDTGTEEPYYYEPPSPQEEPETPSSEDNSGFFAPFRPVNMKRLSWYGNVPFDEEKITPGITSKTHKIIAWSSFGVLALCAVLPLLLLWADDIDKSSAYLLFAFLSILTFPILGQLIPFPLSVRYTKFTRIFSIASIVISGLIVAFLGYIMLNNSLLLILSGETSYIPNILFLIVLIAAIIAGYMSSRHMRVNREGDMRVVSQSTAENNIYGLPGQLQDAVEKFGEDNVQAGMEGEKRTAKLLEDLSLAIPSARIFHGLNFPGSQTADVDHAILVGNRLALIDSKLWRENHYEWDETGNISEIKPNGYSYQRLTNFPVAVHKYSQLFPQLEVRGWILIHPRRGRSDKLSFDNRYAGNTEIADAEHTLNDAGDWLLEGKKAQIVNRRTIRSLFNNMK